MKLALRGWYNEPAYNFRIDFKVFKFIRLQLIEYVIKPYALDVLNEEYFLNITETTGKNNLESLTVTGPFVYKRRKNIDFNIWLPYDLISKSDNYIQAFLYFYFEGLKIVFKNFGINEEEIEKLKKTTEMEVVNNPYYNYSHQEIPPQLLVFSP